MEPWLVIDTAEAGAFRVFGEATLVPEPAAGALALLGVSSYMLTVGRVNPAIPGGGFTDTDPANQTAAAADLILLAAGTARVAVAGLTIGDVDFFRLDLKAGNAVPYSCLATIPVRSSLVET